MLGNNKSGIGNNSLIFKFLIPYMAALFIICVAIYIAYFPQYKTRFLNSNKYNTYNISSEIENNISSLYGKINIFYSYVEKEVNRDNLLNVFKNIINNEPDLINIFYADTIPYKDGGTVLNTVGQLPNDYDQTSREWYKNAIASREIVVSEPYIDVVTKSIVVTFSKTIYVNGQISGVVGIDVDFSKIISSGLEEAKKYNYNLNIINKDGLYIYNQNENYILKENIFNNKEISPYKNDIMNNNNYAWIDKKLSYISSKIKNSNWNIIVSLDNKELNSSLLKLLILIISVFIILSAIEATLVILIAKPISNTLDNTISIIKSMSKGNFNTHFDEKELNKKDQTGDVIRALNDMQNKLGDIIYSMKDNINGINNSVNIITNGNIDLSDRSTSQASSLEELTS